MKKLFGMNAVHLQVKMNDFIFVDTPENIVILMWEWSLNAMACWGLQSGIVSDKT